MTLYETPDFLKDADNVYRTEKYIVKQQLGIKREKELDNVSYSHDTFYLRTAYRNVQYEEHFKDKVNLEGKRIRASMSVRLYIE